MIDPPRRYYKCYGMFKGETHCREHPFIRAEKLEDLVWSEVRGFLSEPGLLLNGINSLRGQEDEATAEGLARAEQALSAVQEEEDRAIRLYVAGKITESQLDRQRRFITERLEHYQSAIDDYRAQAAAGAERRAQVNMAIDWIKRMRQGIDALTPEERRELLLVLVERATIDRNNNVDITVAIPTQELVVTAEPPTFMLVGAMNPCFCGNYGDPRKACTCSSQLLSRYQKRISGPLLDRMDIFIDVPRVEYEKLTGDVTGEPSARIRERVCHGAAGAAGAVPRVVRTVQRGHGTVGRVEVLPYGRRGRRAGARRDGAHAFLRTGVSPHAQTRAHHRGP